MASLFMMASSRLLPTVPSLITQAICRLFSKQNRVCETSINISKTKFHEGRNKRGSGGINVYMSDRVRCNLGIVNCEFHRNRGKMVTTCLLHQALVNILLSLNWKSNIPHSPVHLDYIDLLVSVLSLKVERATSQSSYKKTTTEMDHYALSMQFLLR